MRERLVFRPTFTRPVHDRVNYRDAPELPLQQNARWEWSGCVPEVPCLHHVASDHRLLLILDGGFFLKVGQAATLHGARVRFADLSSADSKHYGVRED
jgi:hypothetical protein